MFAPSQKFNPPKPVRSSFAQDIPQNSILSFANWNQNAIFTSSKQNPRFLNLFRIVFEEISDDFTARIEELREVIMLLEQNTKSSKTESGVKIPKLHLNSRHFSGNDLQIITDRDETTERTDYQ